LPSSGDGVVLRGSSSAVTEWPWNTNVINYKTAIFRQINKEVQHTHHDALEFPTGQIVLLALLEEGQQATVLQLPTTAGVKVPREKEAAFWERVSGSRQLT